MSSLAAIIERLEAVHRRSGYAEVGKALDELRALAQPEAPEGFFEAGREEPWCEEHGQPHNGCRACVGASHDAWMHRAKAAEAAGLELAALVRGEYPSDHSLRDVVLTWGEHPARPTDAALDALDEWEAALAREGEPPAPAAEAPQTATGVLRSVVTGGGLDLHERASAAVVMEGDWEAVVRLPLERARDLLPHVGRPVVVVMGEKGPEDVQPPPAAA